MNNKCKNFRQRTRTKNKKRTVYLYCTELRKEITFDDCRGCEYIELREYKSNNNQMKKCTKNNKNCAFQERKSPKLSKKVQIKKKSSKLAKLERERFSLFSDDVNRCFLCSSEYNLTYHEIFRGKNRLNSMRYGLCLRLCLYCHEKYQEDKEFNDYWHIKGQVKFEEVYSDLEFIDIFGRNYK